MAICYQHDVTKHWVETKYAQLASKLIWAGASAKLNKDLQVLIVYKKYCAKTKNCLSSHFSPYGSDSVNGETIFTVIKY